MKKALFSFSLLITASTFAQKKTPGYLSISGGVAINEDYTKGLGRVSFGVLPHEAIGVGAGIGFVAFEKTYIPLTVDISYFGDNNKLSPIVTGSAGYGIYKYQTQFSTIKGGFTGSINAGVAIPIKRISKVFLMGGYSIYSFTGGQNIQTSGESFKVESSVKMFTVTAGVKI